MRVFTYAERPDLSERLAEAGGGFKPFMGYGAVAEQYWGRLRTDLPHLQLVLYDEDADQVVGHARTIPTREADGLPGGIDDMLLTWFERERPEPDVLSACVAVVNPGSRGQGLATMLIDAMRGLAAREGYDSLLAPVRPTWKDRYPLIPMERYVRWTREDGLPFDPWLRVHARLGAHLLEVCAESMRIEGTREQWEEWAGMAFPEDGEYTLEGALVPVRFENGRGVYVEPNVWMRHSASTARSPRP